MFKFRFTFTRRQTLHGALSQIGAVITHRVSNAQLKGINEKVPRILIVTGDGELSPLRVLGLFCLEQREGSLTSHSPFHLPQMTT